MSSGTRLALTTALLGLAACAAEPSREDEIREILSLPAHFETPYIPDHNPLTREGIELGRHLFYDRRLSGNGMQSCADCHHQDRAFAEDRRTSTGSTGEVLKRNSPGLANVAYLSTLTWSSNGLLHLEDMLHIPIRSDAPIELGVTDGNRDEVLARFDADPEYSRMFREAFRESESGATLNKIVFALASFCRSLISASSPYDRYLAGDAEALTAQQRQGLTLFSGERFECFHCHSGTHFTVAYRDFDTQDDADVRMVFFNTGLYSVDSEGSYPAHDQGLYDLTLDPRHRGLFRPPSLRNIALTAPYMHDGSIGTLREAVQHYTRGGRLIGEGPFAGDGRRSPLKSGLVRAFAVTDEEIDAVVAFLESLTDESFVTNPAFANPFAE